LVKVLREAVGRAVKIAESTPEKGREADTNAFHTLVVPIEVSGNIHAAKITVRESKRVPKGDAAHKFYDVTALQISGNPGVHGLNDTEAPSRPAPSEVSGVMVADLAKAFNLEFHVNPDTVSKVTNPETGEPLVVYHGTNGDFSEFSRVKIGSATGHGDLGGGFYFSDDHRVIGTNKTVGMSVFLCAKDPFLVSMPDFKTPKKTLVPPDAAGDSVMLDYSPTGYIGKEIMVRSPTQIKSATGNTGAFDGSNADILFNKKDYTDGHDTRIHDDTPDTRRAISLLEGAFKKRGRDVHPFHGTGTARMRANDRGRAPSDTT
jgi:hypothetical protein